MPENRRGMAYVLAASLIAASLAACGGGGSDAPPAPPTLAQACAGFEPGGLPHGAAISATEMRAASDLTPETCIVRGAIVSSAVSTITWAVELPDPEAWNEKTVTLGGGGLDGFIPTDDPWYQRLIGPSAAPYVKISSDSGHQTPAFDTAGDDVALRNHAYEANHLVLEVGTAIATTFYGHAPQRRYMFGHSNGGRAGLAAAQRYPLDYDGVVALQPAISQQAHQVNVGELVRHIFSNRDNWLSPAQTALFAAAEIEACDALDGLRDGIISTIEACNYIPTDLLCTGEANDACLTEGQVETIRQIYSDWNVPVTMADGSVGYPRYGRGGAATSDWFIYMFGGSFDEPDSFNHMAIEWAATIVENNPDASALTHDPRQHAQQYLRMSTELDSTHPDLSAFADNGGKLLIWYGLADACVSVYRTAQYVESVQQHLGASRTRDFARFVTSPAVGHELDGPGAGAVDFLAALDAWVEQGAAPDGLVASRFEAGSDEPVLQRPLCDYPMFPRYNGTGDPASADSFTCSES